MVYRFVVVRRQITTKKHVRRQMRRMQEQTRQNREAAVATHAQQTFIPRYRYTYAYGSQKISANLFLASRDGIFIHVRSPGINSKESVSPAHVAWRAGTTRQPFYYSVPSPHQLLKNSSTVYCLVLELLKEKRQPSGDCIQSFSSNLYVPYTVFLFYFLPRLVVWKPIPKKESRARKKFFFPVLSITDIWWSINSTSTYRCRSFI